MRKRKEGGEWKRGRESDGFAGGSHHLGMEREVTRVCQKETSDETHSEKEEGGRIEFSSTPKGLSNPLMPIDSFFVHLPL